MGTGVLYLITFGWFGIGLIYDLFTIPSQVRTYNALKSASNHQHVVVNVVNNNSIN
ncbi:TM2 domain-containing protein [Neobacillus cucumis]|nr:TM2 domain-containing protein [Neobacillus cucumis]